MIKISQIKKTTEHPPKNTNPRRLASNIKDKRNNKTA
jgi:hypothetical protein